MFFGEKCTLSHIQCRFWFAHTALATLVLTSVTSCAIWLPLQAAADTVGGREPVLASSSALNPQVSRLFTPTATRSIRSETLWRHHSHASAQAGEIARARGGARWRRRRLPAAQHYCQGGRGGACQPRSHAPRPRGRSSSGRSATTCTLGLLLVVHVFQQMEGMGERVLRCSMC